MSSDAMAMITDGFDESLVRNVLYVGKTNREQRKIIKCIKDNYKSCKKATDMFWGTLAYPETYPDFILELQMDIECGMVVTVEGSVSEPQSNPFVMPPVLGESLRRLKGLSETVADDNTPNLKSIIEEKDKRIEELEAEVELLRNGGDEAKKKTDTQDEWYTGDYKNLPEDVNMVLRERVVFFATVLSLDLDKKYTVLSNLAKFICKICNDQHNVGPFLSRMKKPEEAEANAKAAKKVAGLMKGILPKEYQNNNYLKINQLVESMLLNFPGKEEE